MHWAQSSLALMPTNFSVPPSEKEIPWTWNCHRGRLGVSWYWFVFFAKHGALLLGQRTKFLSNHKIYYQNVLGFVPWLLCDLMLVFLRNDFLLGTVPEMNLKWWRGCCYQDSFSDVSQIVVLLVFSEKYLSGCSVGQDGNDPSWQYCYLLVY